MENVCAAAVGIIVFARVVIEALNCISAGTVDGRTRAEEQVVTCNCRSVTAVNAAGYDKVIAATAHNGLVSSGISVAGKCDFFCRA